MRLICILFICTALTVSFNSLAGESSFAKDGFFIGYFFTDNSITGDFDRKTVLTSSTEIVLVPKVESGQGSDFVLGVREKAVTYEFHYMSSKHDVTFLDAKGEAEYSAWSLDIKGYFLSKKRFQPFIGIGLIFPDLKVKDAGATSTSSGEIMSGDATFISGPAVNWSGGIAVFISPRVSVQLGVTYHNFDIKSVKGASGITRQLKDKINASSTKYLAGLTFTF